MHFPEAKKGISKIFTAEIVQLISVIVLFAATIIMTTSVGGAIVGLILVTAAFVADIIAFFFNLSGLHSAGVADGNFKAGFVLTIIGIVVVIVGGILMFILGGVTEKIVSVIVTALEIAVTVSVCEGISNVAAKIKGQEDLAKSAKGLMVFIIVLLIVSIIINLVGTFLVAATPMLAVILAVCYLVAEAAAYVIYIILLARAKSAF